MTPKKHLLTLYTRTPLHVGSGSSVDVVDLPIMRERITGFPLIPASSLKGVLLQRTREIFENGAHARSAAKPEDARLLFGDLEDVNENGETKQKSWAGCVQIMEAKLLAFPVRSLAGCYAWLTCPGALLRFQRDTANSFTIPDVEKDHVIHGSELKAGNHVVLEEFALTPTAGDLAPILRVLEKLCADPLWRESLGKRIALVSDENFQHFVTTCTEIVTRVAIDPMNRTVKDGHLFNQENVPCETLFYTVLTVLPSRNGRSEAEADTALATLLPVDPPPLLQIGGDETTGHGICEAKREEITK
jgi:CRISPR-associated protein Cmr4